MCLLDRCPLRPWRFLNIEPQNSQVRDAGLEGFSGLPTLTRAGIPYLICGSRIPRQNPREPGGKAVALAFAGLPPPQRVWIPHPVYVPSRVRNVTTASAVPRMIPHCRRALKGKTPVRKRTTTATPPATAISPIVASVLSHPP